MNRIVRERYPVADLPEDLREGFAADGTVRITVEALRAEARDLQPETPFSLDALFAQARPSFTSSREIDEHLDTVRQEWPERR